MAGGGKPISPQAVHAAEVLSVIQVTKRHLADLLKVDVDIVDGILEELRSSGMPLMSSFAKDNRLYYWLENAEES
jgi:hypothetical protein